MITKVVVSPTSERAKKVLADLTARKEAIRSKIEKKLIEKKMLTKK
jgi:hypothetical protein